MTKRDGPIVIELDEAQAAEPAKAPPVPELGPQERPTGQAMQTMAALMTGEAAPELGDPERMEYFALAPELLADQIVYAIDQPWGVSISDLTVRASGDGYVI